MKITLWPYVLSLLVLLSCATQDQGQNKLKTDPLSNSSVNLEHDYTLSPGAKPELEQKNSEGVYGPVPGYEMDDFEYATKQTKIIPVVGLYLGAGLMRASLHVNVLKALEYHAIQVHMISGMGVGAALATMYAFGLTPDFIEWRVFKFTKAVEGLRPLSEKWKNKLNEILLEGLMDKRIEQANMMLALPLYDQKTSEVVLVTRGTVEQLIEKQFEFSPKATSGKYLSAMLGKGEMARLMSEQGADLKFAVNAMSEKLRFKQGDSFLAGIYGRLIKSGEKQRWPFDLTLELATSQISLDNAGHVDKEIEKSLKKITEQVAQFNSIIKEWKFNKRNLKNGHGRPRVFDQHFLIREND